MAAKLWPDEQKSYIRPRTRTRLLRKSKSNAKEHPRQASDRTDKTVLESGSHGKRIAGQNHRGKSAGRPLSPLLANIYLNEYQKEMASRGVPVIRYADDIVVMAKSSRAAQRLLESTQRYLEWKLKLKMNVEKSKVVSVFSFPKF